mgnify:CR=1 FL=1
MKEDKKEIEIQEVVQTPVVDQEPELPKIFQQLIDVGAHLGRKKSIGHPKMKPYIFTVRQDVQIINLEKIVEKMEEAAEFLKNVASKGGVILFVSVSMPGKHLTKKIAEELKMPYVFERWIGGTLTNFSIISKRINYLLKQEERKQKGELEKYTKKEQLDMENEMKDLNKKIGGIKFLKKHPDAIFIVDAGEHSITIAEAKKVGVPVVSISNTNTDPNIVKHAIPANDKSISTIQFILDYIKDAIAEGLVKSARIAKNKEEVKIINL